MDVEKKGMSKTLGSRWRIGQIASGNVKDCINKTKKKTGTCREKKIGICNKKKVGSCREKGIKKN